MLRPREKPYLKEFNSYYLHLERFVEHLQGEIGAGGVHCQSPHLEMMIYFNETEIISCLIQEKGQEAKYASAFDEVLSAFSSNAFSVQVYQLNAQAIFFWAQMQPFQRAKSPLKSNEIPLPDLLFRLRQKQFSGFVDVRIERKKESGLLFFHAGERVGGSYSWGQGGMSTADNDYNTLLGRIQSEGASFHFGSFISE